MAVPEGIQFHTAPDGSLDSLSAGGCPVPLRRDRYRGMKLWLQMAGEPREIPLTPVGESVFAARVQEQDYQLSYRETGGALEVKIRVHNSDEVSFCPRTLFLTTGIDCYMERYPQWNEMLFPTLLRCEKTHFWGYCMSPQGMVLAMASPDPIASWSLEYSRLQDEWSEHHYLTGGHRIDTFHLHLLAAQPQPQRHPVLQSVGAHGTREWTLYFSRVDSPEFVLPWCAQFCRAPMLELERYTVDPGETVAGVLLSRPGTVHLTLLEPDGSSRPVAVRASGFSLEAPGAVGLYTLRAQWGLKVSEGSFYVKRKNSWYLRMGRQAVLENPPVYTHHVEAFLSLYTILLARKHLPDERQDAQCEEYFQEILEKLYNPQTGRVRENPWRIQDSAALGALMALRYTVTGDPRDLHTAGSLADYLMECQGEDGAYYSMPSPQMVSPEQGTHYTAVTYIAKYVLEVSREEELAAREYPEFLESARRHRQSAQRAIAELERSRDNIETEGEMTFEDGMISCSLLQIAFRALQMAQSPERQRYADTAREMARLHRCLTQQLVPDCRMNGATLRFWEAQYNIHLFHNGMNSPCGWTCWKVYGDYYLYLLTGEPQYLREAMNGLGACLQLVDGKTGHLRWGFLADPHIECLRFVPCGQGDEEGKLIWDTVGEQYLEQVSSWHRTQPFPRPKWGIDNLVHEIFKCLAEISLTNAFVIWREGKLTAYNCRVTRRKDGSLLILPREELVCRVHCNFDEDTNVEVRFSGRTVCDRRRFGWVWRMGPPAP